MASSAAMRLASSCTPLTQSAGVTSWIGTLLQASVLPCQTESLKSPPGPLMAQGVTSKIHCAPKVITFGSFLTCE